jgi:hypothetical protein
MLNFTFDEAAVVKSEFVKLFLWCWSFIDFTQFCNFFNTCKRIFGVGMLCGYAVTFPWKEGGIQVLAGLPQYIQQ